MKNYRFTNLYLPAKISIIAGSEEDAKKQLPNGYWKLYAIGGVCR